MSVATVSIDRTSLTLSALAISGDGTGTYSLTQHGLGRPAVAGRLTYADESPDVAGSLLLQAVREQSTLALELLVQAASSSALETALDALDAALWQLSYDITVTVDGVATVWACHPASWQLAGGTVEHAHVAAFLEVVSVTIPVQPQGA